MSKDPGDWNVAVAQRGLTEDVTADRQTPSGHTQHLKLTSYQATEDASVNSKVKNTQLFSYNNAIQVKV